jgi:hypothetical protein
MICESCRVAFEGRPNRRYCSRSCKVKAELRARARKKEEQHKAWLETLPPGERAFWDSIPTEQEVFGDLPTADWGERTDWGEPTYWEEPQPPVKGNRGKR